MTATKICSNCGLRKPVLDFYQNPAYKDGYQSRCKSCSKQYYSDNREKFREQRARRRLENPALQRTELLRNYGLTLEQYDSILENQKGVCAVCHSVNKNGRSLSVDHDHTCCPGPKSCGDCVRGLLCADCNSADGFLNSDPHRAIKLAQYMIANQNIQDWLFSESIFD